MPLKFPTVTWIPLPFGRVRILAAGIGEPEAPFIVSKSVEFILVLSSGEISVVDHDVMLCCRGMDQLPRAALLFPPVLRVLYGFQPVGDNRHQAPRREVSCCFADKKSSLSRDA